MEKSTKKRESGAGFGAETEKSRPEKHKETIGAVRGSEAAKRLKHERFGAEAPVGLLRKISHAKHRNLLKEGFGAKIVKSILFAMKRQDWHGLLKN